jgi:hypothetical protein
MHFQNHIEVQRTLLVRVRAPATRVPDGHWEGLRPCRGGGGVFFAVNDSISVTAFAMHMMPCFLGQMPLTLQKLGATSSSRYLLLLFSKYHR